MIGILLYLLGTRPNIMHAVGIVGRLQTNPKEIHLKLLKVYSSIWRELKIFDYDIPRTQSLHSKHILMHIRPTTLIIEKVSMEDPSSWDNS